VSPPTSVDVLAARLGITLGDREPDDRKEVSFCWVGFNRWRKQWDHERSFQVKVCHDCEKRMRTGTGAITGPF
jgi:hypothetical protein